MSKTKKDTYKNEEHSLSSYTSSSSDEEVDAEDLKPIKEYLSNRKELGRQLFKSVKPEKIRMMLPQVLKQADLKELEQWCVSELSGMSKTRILSILNDKPMLESSDTSEAEDSGPSLEIISDTEEWLTDDDICKKEDDGMKKLKKNKIKVKGKAQVSKTSDTDKSNVKGKVISKNDNNDKIKDIKIKKEDSKDKEKEGDSLLDLLELEMRARAIRALIRKEEDIIPSSNSSQTNNSQTTDNDAKALQIDDAIAKEDYRKQLERIINAKQVSIGEDEDVVLVVQPTPVVELLSSESDGENNEGTSINDKLKNKYITETEKSSSISNEDAEILQFSQDSQERKETQQTTSQNNADTVFKIDLNTRGATKAKMSDRNVDIKNNILSISISANNIADKRKKSKRKLRPKSQLAPSTCNIVQNFPKSKRIKNVEITEQLIVRNENINEQSETSQTLVETRFTAEEENNTEEKIAEESKIEKEKSADSDEIIDLDDYCDVMDIENCDDDKSQDKIIVLSQQNKESVPQSVSTAQTSDSSETWASRYYQTDDVQNVIKESKIQSEIRKRLRERQRLSKLNKSPNMNLSSQTPANQTSVVSEKTPTGSVEEYLALKRATNTNVSISNSDSSITTIPDNPATVSSTNDSAKENLIQDESNPSHPESTDSTNVAIETNCPPSCLSAEAVTTEAVTAEAVIAEAVTTEAVTAEAVTAEAATTEAVTAEAVIAEAVTAEAVTAETVTAEAVTAEAVTAEAVTAEAVTTGAVTAEAVTTEAVTVEATEEITEITNDTQPTSNSNII